jgi:hypothetical protein
MVSSSKIMLAHPIYGFRGSAQGPVGDVVHEFSAALVRTPINIVQYIDFAGDFYGSCA